MLNDVNRIGYYYVVTVYGKRKTQNKSNHIERNKNGIKHLAAAARWLTRDRRNQIKVLILFPSSFDFFASQCRRSLSLSSFNESEPNTLQHLYAVDEIWRYVQKKPTASIEIETRIE